MLGTVGPNIGTESGCSSSGVAVGMAVQALRRKEIDLAIVGGVNVLLTCILPSDMKGFLSPDFQCKTFDASADGFVRAEGFAFSQVAPVSIMKIFILFISDAGFCC